MLLFRKDLQSITGPITEWTDNVLTVTSGLDLNFWYQFEGAIYFYSQNDPELIGLKMNVPGANEGGMYVQHRPIAGTDLGLVSSRTYPGDFSGVPIAARDYADNAVYLRGFFKTPASGSAQFSISYRNYAMNPDWSVDFFPGSYINITKVL
ncbi:hypothetical protein [Nonomuraea sp. CA-141351]|uniref:hypothetical protein n=1 Tax=Nonomuraea sp. CA-141351 TaxID=3239996 RepID=UPI003D9030E5